jgi:hypothetical protein
MREIIGIAITPAAPSIVINNVFKRMPRDALEKRRQNAGAASLRKARSRADGSFEMGFGGGHEIPPSFNAIIRKAADGIP